MNDHVARSAADVEDCWTLRAADRALLGNKTGATRLGFAVLLRLFQVEGRFPRRPEDVPAAVEALTSQVGVPAAAWQGHDWHGRTVEHHRARLRAALGFREATLDDADALDRWHRQLGGWPACPAKSGRVAGRDDDARPPQLRRHCQVDRLWSS